MEAIFDVGLINNQILTLEQQAKDTKDADHKKHLNQDLTDMIAKYNGLKNADLASIQEDLFYEIDPNFLTNVSPRNVSIVQDPARIGAGDAILTTIPCGLEVDGTYYYYHILEGLRYRHTSISISSSPAPFVSDRVIMFENGSKTCMKYIPVAFKSTHTYKERIRAIEAWLTANVTKKDAWFDLAEAVAKNKLGPLMNGDYLIGK